MPHFTKMFLFFPISNILPQPILGISSKSISRIGTSVSERGKMILLLPQCEQLHVVHAHLGLRSTVTPISRSCHCITRSESSDFASPS